MDEKTLTKKLQFIDDYKKASNAATGSKYDSNANVTQKNLSTLQVELGKKDLIDINRGITKKYLLKLYGEQAVKDFEEDLKNHIIYSHDETSILPYCASISLYPFLLNGLKDLGGSSNPPKHADSFIGGIINLIFLASSQLAGACLYKNQPLLIQQNNKPYQFDAKDFVNKFKLPYKYDNHQGTWEYANIENLDYYINEDQKLVKIKKVMRRKYTDLIYKISTKDGHTALVSKDHIFKVLYGGRILNIKAEDLKLYDTVFMDKDTSIFIDYNSKDFKEGFIKGVLCGDGNITQEPIIRLSIHPEQTYIGEIFNEFLIDTYNIKLNESDRVSNGALDYRKHSVEKYPEICNHIVGRNTYNKHIDNIKDKTLNWLVGFLDGLFITDGCYKETRGICLRLTNKQLIEDVCSILDILQIKYNPYTIIPAYKNKKESYNLYIPHTILNYIKYTQLKKIKSTNYQNKIHRGKYSYRYSDTAFRLRKNSSRINLWSCSNQPEYYNTDVITNIETFKNDDNYVYEIETDSHWYNCSGFITHNCAIPELLTYFDYFLRVDYGNDYINHLDDLLESWGNRKATLRNKIEDLFQQFTYCINQPAGARNYQSPFINIAYFDKYYFESIFENFVFPDGDIPNWESTKELQKLYMQWFNEERTKSELTFPVETANILVDKETHEYKDKEQADFLAYMWSKGHSFFCYQSDSVDALASCCFRGDEIIRVRNKETKDIIDITLKDFCEKYKDSYSCFEILSYNKDLREEEYTSITGTLIKQNEFPNLIEIETYNGDVIRVTPEHILLVEDKNKNLIEIKAKDLINSYEDYELLCSDDNSKIKNIKVIEGNCNVYDIELEKNHFFYANNILTHNCRLRNEVEKEEFSYTLGAGGIKTGSKKVITLNLNRITQDWYRLNKEREEKLPLSSYIEKITNRVHQYLTAWAAKLQDDYDAGLLPLYKAGYIDLDKQFLTVGVNGCIEAAEFLQKVGEEDYKGIEIDPFNEQYRKLSSDILGTIESLNKKHKTPTQKFNQEFVPAESAASKLYNWDKRDGYWVPKNRNSYNSYFYPVESEKISPIERFFYQGYGFADICSGGVALHNNLNEHLTQTQYRMLMDIAVKAGCNYFTYNIPNTVCNDCGHIDKNYLHSCPKCGSSNLDYLTRVIGYLKRVSNFSEARQLEASRRHYSSI